MPSGPESASAKPAGALESYGALVDAVAERRLRPYLNQLAKSAHAPSPKEINDAVWKTVVLRPFEVLLLDSPLLQRLRRVRQLGVVHWVYPSADHSRFEHSIGAVHMVQQVVDSMNADLQLAEADGVTTIPEKYVNLLRCAALCHDIGHLFMSHVSEHPMQALEGVRTMRSEFRAKTGRKASLSEITAYLLVGSSAFRELLTKAEELTKHTLPHEVAGRIQKAIVGEIIHERYPLLQELVTGPFDADKLDYMTRDSLATGVPPITDIPRLIQKIRLVQVSPDRLPARISERVQAGEAFHFVSAIAFSGARTLDELMLGRTLLFDKVYRHQKVRAAEAMVASLIACLESVLASDFLAACLELTDHEVLHLSAEAIERSLDKSLPASQRSALEPACEIASLLRQRRLLHRAYAFSHTLPRDPFRDDREQRAGLEQARREFGIPEGREQIHGRIIESIRKMIGVLPGELAPETPDDMLPYLVVLDPPPPETKASETERAYLTPGPNELMPFSDTFSQSSPWSKAYLLTRDIGYVFAPRDLGVLAFLASELVLREEFGVRTPDSVFHYAKLPLDLVERYRTVLQEKGFYDDAPRDLRAPPNRLKRGDIPARLQKIALQLGRFEGLSPEDGSIATVRVTSERIAVFLRQFESDDEVDGALAALENIRIISREDVLRAVATFVEENPQFEGAYVCPLGGPQDSSGHVTYYAQDLKADHGLKPVKLVEALADEPKPILFVDDFVGSGRQLHTILMGLFGERDDDCLDEDHGRPLEQHLADGLKERELGFCFASGDPEAAKRLEKTAKVLGLRAHMRIGVPTTSLPRAFGEGAIPYPSSAAHDAFRSACETTTRAIFEAEDRTNNWIKDRVLGYGNDAYLVAFPYNVPTATLTILWKAGSLGTWDWLPLLPRRAKT